MGGHGGLNILPQKKWNVYRQDRQYQVKFDEHRDIERKLQAKDELKKGKLRDSLVLLRRKAQSTQNIDDEDFDVEKETKSKRKRQDDDAPESDDPHSADFVLEFDKKVSKGHVNLFEKEEKEFNEYNRKKRESLIKSGCFIYNTKSKGPRNVNVYVDDEDAKLVPDFNKVTVPWYMLPPGSTASASISNRPRTRDDASSTEVLGDTEARNNLEDVKKSKSIDELRKERLARESSERERALALLKSR